MRTKPSNAAPGGRTTAPAGRLKDRLRRILEILAGAYPDARCELDFQTPLELLVATVLSAQCTDQRVNRVTPALFRTYRTARDYAAADPAVFEAEIRSTGFFRSKARNILACCRTLAADFGGRVPQTLEELTALPGVGRKTANILRYNAYGLPGFGVDTHVIRVTNRLGLVETEKPEQIEAAICAHLPDAEWGMASHRFIFHGRRTCHARTPGCGRCSLRPLCPLPAAP